MTARARHLAETPRLERCGCGRVTDDVCPRCDVRLAEADVDEVARLGMGVLGLFGGAYDVAVLPVSLKALAVQILRAGHRSHAAYADGVLFARDSEELVAVPLR